MAVIFMTGGIKDAQGIGPILNATNSQLWAVNAKRPKDLRYLGGHFIPEAPEFTDTEAVTVGYPYVDRAGINRIRNETIIPITASEMVLTITPPPNYKTAIQDAKREQVRTRTTHHAVIFSNNCGTDECDQFFRVAPWGTIGDRRSTSGAVVPVSSDEAPESGNETSEVTWTFPDVYWVYDALVSSEIVPFTNAIHFALEDIGCDAGLCPWNEWYVGGAEAYLARTNDKFGTRTVIDTATIVADITGEDESATITSGVKVGSRLIVGYTNQAGTDGGAGYSVGDNAVVLSTFSVASTGVNAMLEAFGRIWTFGNDGQIFYSCDEGVTFTAFDNTIEDNILTVAFDEGKRWAYIGTEDGGLYMFNGKALISIGATVGLGAGQDVTAIATNNEDYVIVGTSNGVLYESMNASRMNNAQWEIGGTFTGAIHFIGLDTLGLRTIVSAGSTWHQRDVLTQQRWVQKDTLTAPIIAGAVGEYQDKEGMNFAVMFTDNGAGVIVESCQPCETESC